MRPGGVFTPRKDKTSDGRYSLKLSPEDWAKTDIGRNWTARVTDLATGQQYVASGMDCGADCFCDAIATPVPKSRPRKYRMPEVEADKHVTGDMIREITADYPDELRAEMLAMAIKLDARGWIEAAGRLYVTGATARWLEAEAEEQLREHEAEGVVPGFYAEWGRTVGVHEYEAGEPKLRPVITMFAINPADSHEKAAGRYTAVAQEHGRFVGRLA
jgi:hypothetical protein